MQVELSIIIRTKDEINTLPNLIKFIQTQSFRNIETILVDNESVDGTKEYGLKYCDKVVTISKAAFSHAYSCNLGAQYAEADLIYFTNGHSLPKNKDIFTQAVNFMKANEKCVGAFGRCFPFGDKRSSLFEKIIKVLDEIQLPNKLTKMDKFMPGIMQTQSALIKKQIFLKYPFEKLHDTGGEDSLWAMKMLNLGYEIFYLPELDVFHSHGKGELESINRFRKYRKLIQLLKKKIQ